MYRRKVFVASLVFTMAMAACIGAAEPVISLKFGHTGPPSHHYQLVGEQFAAEVRELTNGRIDIGVFPADQLGNQMESTEGAMLGTHDMILTSDMVLSNWVPDMGILNLPFLFKDNDHLRKVLDGEIGRKLAAKVDPTGAVLIGWWDNGFRQITNSKHPINSPADLVGMKMRIPEGMVYLDTFSALGSIPTVIASGEIYSALQLKTVDGQENGVSTISAQRFYEVNPYISRTNHMHSCSPLLINGDKLASIPEADRKILVDTCMKYGKIHTDTLTKLEEDEYWPNVIANGMKANTPPDIEPFIKAVQPVYDKARKNPSLDSALIDEILSLR